MELAGRLDRFWAAIIDRALFLGLVAATVALSIFRGSSSPVFVIGCIVALLALVGAQVWLLTAHGQTIGKRIIGLRIVKVSDMTNGGFVTNVLLRTVANAAISAVPVAGSIYFLADPAFIFRDDRRCVHDHIAGTCVIKA
ncbi:MAG: RDD family protein [Elusimicrobia bacterium]|nr:RDD family protein [Elusimicrobiota bacterium]